MQAVKDWEEPFVGGAPNTSQDSAYLRGAQWRLVMAYNAFEIVCFALMKGKYASAEQRFTQFVDCCDVGVLPRRVDSPSRDRTVMQRWLGISVDESAKQGDPLLDFLGLGGGDRKVFQAWLLNGQAIESWSGAALLAKALRNMTAHGALSATKVKELGLRPGIEALTVVLCDLVMGAIDCLAKGKVNSTADCDGR